MVDVGDVDSIDNQKSSKKMNQNDQKGNKSSKSVEDFVVADENSMVERIVHDVVHED